MAHTLTGRTGPRRRAFSLIEMLVVLLILTVIISIVIPAIGHFRNAARKSGTQEVMASLAQSTAQFRMDKNRLPGRFTAREMGDPANATGAVGGGGGGQLSMMENMMLDLAGGVDETTTNSSGSGDPCIAANWTKIKVGPTNTRQVIVDLTRIGSVQKTASGATARQYFNPDPRFFVRQCLAGQRGSVLPPDERLAMPVLVDYWGSPLLAWQTDTVPQGTPLTSPDSGNLAQFYLAQNACFINATKMGKLGYDQTDPNTGSLLRTAAPNPDRSLGTVLHKPGFSSEPRGPIVFHSAGANGVYIGKQDRGGKTLTGATGSGEVRPAPGDSDIFAEGYFDDFVTKAE